MELVPLEFSHWNSLIGTLSLELSLGVFRLEFCLWNCPFGLFYWSSRIQLLALGIVPLKLCRLELSARSCPLESVPLECLYRTSPIGIIPLKCSLWTYHLIFPFGAFPLKLFHRNSPIWGLPLECFLYIPLSLSLLIPIAVLPFDLFHWKSANGNLPLDISHTNCSFQLSHWNLSCGFSLKFPHWNCPIGLFPLPFWQ